jgi:hypothetical protein
MGGTASIFPIRQSEYQIHILTTQANEEQEKGFIHEVAHVYYQCGRKWGASHDSRDDLIEAEIQRFYGEHKEFVQKLFASLRS